MCACALYISICKEYLTKKTILARLPNLHDMFKFLKYLIYLIIHGKINKSETNNVVHTSYFNVNYHNSNEVFVNHVY